MATAPTFPPPVSEVVESKPSAESTFSTTSQCPPMAGTTYGLQHWLQQQQQQHHQHPHGHGGQHSAKSRLSDGSSPRTATAKTAIFWDFENCPPPSGMPGYVVVDNIRNVIHHFGDVTMFKAYLEISDSASSQKALRSELQSSGVSLTDCPHNGRKDAADKMIMVDMLAFAIDHPPPANIVLISGDRDFVYALSTLRNRRYNIVLIVPNRGAPIILKSQANVILEWRYDVLNQDVWAMQQQQLLMSTTQPSSTSVASSNLPQTRPTISAATNNSPSSIDQNSPEGLKRNMAVTVVAPSTENKDRSVSPLHAIQLPNVSPNMIQPSRPKGLQLNTENLRIQTITANKERSDLKVEEDYVGYCFSPRAPGFFDLMVEVLEKFRLQGEPQPRRSKVGIELAQRNPLLYHRAGCSSFKEYVELACKEGIVNVGGEKGLAWMSLNENYRDKCFN